MTFKLKTKKPPLQINKETELRVWHCSKIIFIFLPTGLNPVRTWNTKVCKLYVSLEIFRQTLDILFSCNEGKRFFSRRVTEEPAL